MIVPGPSDEISKIFTSFVIYLFCEVEEEGSGILVCDGQRKNGEAQHQGELLKRQNSV
jgi:hypothetical protein